MARWILRYGTSRRGYLRGKRAFEPRPWGYLLRRTRENAVVLARTVSAPLAWRRKKTLRRNPADRVRLEELRVEYQLQLAGPMRF